MATTSHLPHVIANVLAREVEGTLGEGGERLPEVGPSLRDATRVAGANPAIWEDIFLANRDPRRGCGGRRGGVSVEAAEVLRSGTARTSPPGTARPAGRARGCLPRSRPAGR